MLMTTAAPSHVASHTSSRLLLGGKRVIVLLVSWQLDGKWML